MTSVAEVPADGVIAEPILPRASAWPKFLLVAGVAIVGFLVRLMPLLIGGGLSFSGRYDDGVYYTAAESLTFGRLPYRDFMLLHPPGLIVALVPFATLGRLTTDPTGMAVGRVAFMMIGALNAVLVAILANRWGRRAAITAGLLYACWMPAVYGEQSTLLEPLGTTGILTALLLLCRRDPDSVRPRHELIAGVALGLSVTLKVWYAAPILVVVVAQLMRRRYGSAARTAAATVSAAAVVLVPFFVEAPGQMFRMVVLDQLGRAGRTTSPFVRLPYILGVRPLANGHPAEIAVCTAIALTVVGLAGVLCLTDAPARLIVGVAALDGVVLMLTPAFFLHYGELTAAPLALVIGIGISKLPGMMARPAASRALVAACAAAILVSGVDIAATPEGTAFPKAEFTAAAPPGCITADDPDALIQMNRLTSDLRAHCVVPVDVSGITYDRLSETTSAGTRIGRGLNEAWQGYLHDYLFSGTAFVVMREGADSITPPYSGMEKRAPVLARDQFMTLRSGFDTGPMKVRGVEAIRTGDDVRGHGRDR